MKDPLDEIFSTGEKWGVTPFSIIGTVLAGVAFGVAGEMVGLINDPLAIYVAELWVAGAGIAAGVHGAKFASVNPWQKNVAHALLLTSFILGVLPFEPGATILAYGGLAFGASWFVATMLSPRKVTPPHPQ
ncbi:hypothetical protein HON52_02485 [Candidatus Uhrbacteria bacterium]|jgi:hypothetical protein|nr:hypothetical protein [Candidatus Uhrbacteria bacterium]